MRAVVGVRGRRVVAAVAGDKIACGDAWWWPMHGDAMVVEAVAVKTSNENRILVSNATKVKLDCVK